MTIALSSPITGSAVSGLTSPTFTLTADVAPTALGRQWAVTALGGTQTGVTPSSVGSPFTVNFVRPAAYKVLSAVNPVTGVLQNVPMNHWEIIFRKGMIPLSGQAVKPAVVRILLDLPAGVDTADPNSVRSLISFIGGVFASEASDVADSVITGVW